MLNHIPAQQDFREVLDGLDVGVAMCSRRGMIRYANSQFAKMLQIRARHDLVGENLSLHIPTNCREPFHCASIRAAAGKAELELKADGASGGMRTIRLYFTPVRKSRGAQIQIVVIDVSELARANENLKHTQASLQSLSARILRVQDEARRRIARDLHDITGQDLSVVAMSLSRITKILGPEASDVRDAVTDALERVRTVEQELRTVSYLLHPPLLDDLGLAPALRWYIEGFTKQTESKLAWKSPANFNELTLKRKSQFFESCRKALRMCSNIRAASTPRSGCSLPAIN